MPVARASANNPDSAYTPAGFLAKTVAKNVTENFDFLVTDYAYDSSSHLSSIIQTEKLRQTNNSIKVTVTNTKFSRDNAGRIISISSVSDASNIFFNIAYENTLSRKITNISTYKVSSPGAMILLDSTVFEYNINDLIAKTSHHSSAATSAPVLVSYQQYLYDNAGNMTEAKLFQDDNRNGTFANVLTYKWDFTNIVNPEYFDEPGYFFLQQQLFPYTCSPLACSRQHNFYFYAGSTNDMVSYTFQFNTLGKISLVKKDGDAENETRYFYY